MSKLIIRHFHENVYHQGRRVTSAAVRTAGFWIIGEQRIMPKIIGTSVTCGRLRSPSLTQHTADLLAERAKTPPSFTYVGCDVFGPWSVQNR